MLSANCHLNSGPFLIIKSPPHGTNVRSANRSFFRSIWRAYFSPFRTHTRRPSSSALRPTSVSGKPADRLPSPNATSLAGVSDGGQSDLRTAGGELAAWTTRILWRGAMLDECARAVSQAAVCGSSTRVCRRFLPLRRLRRKRNSCLMQWNEMCRLETLSLFNFTGQVNFKK